MKYFTGQEEQIPLAEINDAVEDAFADHGRGAAQMPPKIYVTFPKGDFRTMPAYLPRLDIAGVKVVNVHPGNPALGLPTVMALTVILDVETGIPEAVINATRLTDLRTGAAGAVAAKYLAPKKSVVLGMVGAGRQAAAQAHAIAVELEIEEILVWSRTPRRAEDCASVLGMADCRIVSMERACDCDVLVTTTPTTKPIVRSEWVHEGTHINAIGADAPGKEELDPAVLKRAKVFIDDWDQAVHSGEVNVPITKGIYRADEIAGTLGEVVLGSKGRGSAEEITVFDSTGLALQDLAIAHLAMEYGKGADLPFP